MRFFGDGLRRLSRFFLVIGFKLRFGDGFDFGSSLSEVTFEEDNSDQCSKNHRDHRN